MADGEEGDGNNSVLAGGNLWLVVVGVIIVLVIIWAKHHAPQ